MTGRVAPRSGTATRVFARDAARLLGSLGLCVLLAQAPGPACAAPSGTVATGSVEARPSSGYLRLVFQFDHMPEVTTRVANNILVIDFAGRVAVPLEPIQAAIGDYVSGMRLDPDGRAVRLALSQRLTVNAMPAGERLFVDLLPASWQGPPPGLPPEIVAELTAKAREAERLEREEQARVAAARNRVRPIDVSVARQPTFTRLAFELGAPVPVQLERSGQTAKIVFDAALKTDLAAIKAELPPNLAAIDATEGDAHLAVRLRLADGADMRTFWDGGDYVVDLTGAAAAPVDVAATLAAAAAKVEPPAMPAPAVPAKAEPPAGPMPAVPAETPQPAVPVQVPARPEPVSLPDPAPRPAAVDFPDGPTTPAPAARPSVDRPVPAVAEPADTGPLRPVVARSGETVRLAFPFAEATPAAMYRRGDTLWLVFDTGRRIDVGAVAAAAPDIVAAAAATAADGAVIVRLTLKVSPLVTTSPDGAGWTVSIGNDILGAAQPVALRRATDAGGRTAVTAIVAGLGSVHRIEDGDVGDTVFVVTAAAPARGFLKPQSFVEFRTLVTAHGLAFVPTSDDVVVTAGIDMVTVSRDGGLTLSANGVPAAPAADPGHRSSVVDTGQWAREIEAPFEARQQVLLKAAAEASEAGRLAARTDLARFYLAKDFGAEAAAVLDVAGAEDKRAGRDPEFGLLRAASLVLIGRGEEATALLAEQGLAASPEGALWQGLAALARHDLPAARAAFQRGEGAISLYPRPVQARFRLGAYEAAIAAGDAGDALAQKQALDGLDVEAASGPRRELLDGRFAELTQRKAEALAFYDKLADGPASAAAAEARLRALPLRRDVGKIGDKGLLDGLETLAATWRGDTVEVQTLKALADEYLKAGKDRQAFDTMRVALERFPLSEATRSMQDRLQRRFVELFLDDGALKLPPVDALALFYDYQDLTPSDRRGDEMIRRLADRLVEVDLLDQAAELLQHQVDNRLSGAGRAQVAARLAMIDLMNRKPVQALQVLAATRQPGLPKDLMTARVLLGARALAETARYDLALEMLDQLDGPDVARVRADVLWQARRWPAAAEALENQLGDSWQGPGPLTDVQRNSALRAAIAYSLADDRIGLDRLRSKFTARMADSADAASFEAVTAPIEARGANFSDIARGIAAADTLDAFLKDYRAHYLAAPLPAEPSAAVVDPQRPNAG